MANVLSNAGQRFFEKEKTASSLDPRTSPKKNNHSMIDQGKPSSSASPFKQVGSTIVSKIPKQEYYPSQMNRRGNKIPEQKYTPQMNRKGNKHSDEEHPKTESPFKKVSREILGNQGDIDQLTKSVKTTKNEAPQELMDKHKHRLKQRPGTAKPRLEGNKTQSSEDALDCLLQTGSKKGRKKSRKKKYHPRQLTSSGPGNSRYNHSRASTQRNSILKNQFTSTADKVYAHIGNNLDNEKIPSYRDNANYTLNPNGELATHKHLTQSERGDFGVNYESETRNTSTHKLSEKKQTAVSTQRAVIIKKLRTTSLEQDSLANAFSTLNFDNESNEGRHLTQSERGDLGVNTELKTRSTSPHNLSKKKQTAVSTQRAEIIKKAPTISLKQNSLANVVSTLNPNHESNEERHLTQSQQGDLEVHYKSGTRNTSPHKLSERKQTAVLKKPAVTTEKVPNRSSKQDSQANAFLTLDADSESDEHTYSVQSDQDDSDVNDALGTLSGVLQNTKVKHSTLRPQTAPVRRPPAIEYMEHVSAKAAWGEKETAATSAPPVVRIKTRDANKKVSIIPEGFDMEPFENYEFEFKKESISLKTFLEKHQYYISIVADIEFNKNGIIFYGEDATEQCGDFSEISLFFSKDGETRKIKAKKINTVEELPLLPYISIRLNQHGCFEVEVGRRYDRLMYYFIPKICFGAKSSSLKGIGETLFHIAQDAFQKTLAKTYIHLLTKDLETSYLEEEDYNYFKSFKRYLLHNAGYTPLQFAKTCDYMQQDPASSLVEMDQYVTKYTQKGFEENDCINTFLEGHYHDRRFARANNFNSFLSVNRQLGLSDNELTESYINLRLREVGSSRSFFKSNILPLTFSKKDSGNCESITGEAIKFLKFFNSYYSRNNNDILYRYRQNFKHEGFVGLFFLSFEASYQTEKPDLDSFMHYLRNLDKNNPTYIKLFENDILRNYYAFYMLNYTEQ